MPRGISRLIREVRKQRHAHAAELAHERFPVNLIQQQLGHANLSVTSRYLDHITPQERVAALKAREWRAWPYGWGLIAAPNAR